MMTKNEISKLIFSELNSDGIDCAECNIADEVVTEVYFENGKINLIRTNYNTDIAVKVVKDGKKGQAKTNSVSEESIKNLVSDTLIALETAIPDEAEGICDEPAKRSFSKGVKTPDLGAMYDRLSEFLSDVKVKMPTIGFNQISLEHVFCDGFYTNTNGTEISENNGYYRISLTFMASDGKTTSSLNGADCLFYDISKPILSLSAIERLLYENEKMITTVPIDGKFDGEIIFSPDCFGGLMADIEAGSLSDLCLIDGTSIYKDKLNMKIASEAVSISSCPKSDEIVSASAITSDGYLSDDMPVIENGILKNFFVGRYGSKKTGLKRSASHGGCYIMKNGEKPLDGMIKSVKKGLYVNRLSGGQPAGNGDFSAVAKNSFLIENGKITDAVSETMITGNLAKMLLDITEISKETRSDGNSVFPWVKVNNMAISGK